MNARAEVLGLDGRAKESTLLPEVFGTSYRPDVIHRVYVNMLSTDFRGKVVIRPLAR